uniref:Uncharacterized protein n=1 Tax=Ciona savignyi TaxID=51511 RepID=H2YYB1_CIOSA
MVKQTNVKNRKLICDKLLTFQTQLEADYSDKLYEVSRKRYAQIDDLENVHTGFKSAVKREVKSLIPFSDIYKETIKLSFERVDAQYQKVEREYKEIWKEYSDNLSLNWSILAPAVEGMATFCGKVMRVLTSSNEEIDVSKLKSILYLKELNL